MSTKVYGHRDGRYRLADEEESTETEEYPKEVQCEGMTEDGTRCERVVTLESEDDEPYCYQHR